ncbi:hypothetical protein [Mycobacterium marinum]|uniref:hypothetical protein n=1 Tax=Mycobacterium marinum TaxID=1781 RepID=UPI003BEEC86E
MNGSVLNGGVEICGNVNSSTPIDGMVIAVVVISGVVMSGSMKAATLIGSKVVEGMVKPERPMEGIVQFPPLGSSMVK